LFKIVEQNRKAVQNPPRVVAPTEEEEPFVCYWYTREVRRHLCWDYRPISGK